MTSARVLLADDHAIVVEGLRRVLEPAFTVVAAVSDGRALVDAAAALAPDVIVADISMPLLNGIEAAREIRRGNDQVKIVFFTMHADVVYASGAFRAGASAYVLKSSMRSEIVAAIREALAGRIYLSPELDRRTLETQLARDGGTSEAANQLPQRQREVVRMVAQGLTTKRIADVLGISPRTVEFHRYQAMRTLGVHTIGELIQYAIKHHIVML
jgi:DNA-binding NarL/FixJ family response regulator